MALPPPGRRMRAEDEEDTLTTEPAVRDAEQQARLQERQARWMGVAVVVVVLLAALALH